MKFSLETSVINCSAYDCRWNYCPNEDPCCLMKFVNINKDGHCANFERKVLVKP